MPTPTDAQRQAQALCPLGDNWHKTAHVAAVGGCYVCRPLAAALAAADAAGYERGLAAGERQERRAILAALDKRRDSYMFAGAVWQGMRDACVMDYGEPWSVVPERGAENFGDFTIWARDGFVAERDGFVANVDDNPEGQPVAFDLSEERAQRIKACVNACAGMADPQAEITSLRAETERLKGRAEQAEHEATAYLRRADAVTDRMVEAERERDEARTAAALHELLSGAFSALDPEQNPELSEQLNGVLSCGADGGRTACTTYGERITEAEERGRRQERRACWESAKLLCGSSGDYADENPADVIADAIAARGPMEE